MVDALALFWFTPPFVIPLQYSYSLSTALLFLRVKVHQVILGQVI